MYRLATLSTLLICALVLAFSNTGCVRKTEFDAQTAALEQNKTDLAQCKAELEEASRNAERLVELQALLDSRTERANQDLEDLRKSLDESAALNASLRQELERMGANVDKLLQEKGALATNLESTKNRLEELRRAQAAAERRNQQMRQLVERFRKMADAGVLKVAVRRGRMVLQLPNDVLFDSGQAEVKPNGIATIKDVAAILKTIPNRQFQVAGHTDNEPIRSSAYPSNWYLSSSRAIKVVESLIASGVAPANLSASGYGEFDPIAANNSPANKAKNRRIEIIIQPNVDELLTQFSEAGL